MDANELEDMARSAFEEAMAFGVGFDSFRRLAVAVQAKERVRLCSAIEEKCREWDGPAEAYGLRLAMDVVRGHND